MAFSVFVLQSEMSFKPNMKNASGSEFHMELSRLNKEIKNEMRMLNNEKQRFKKKYSKLDIYNDNPITEVGI